MPLCFPVLTSGSKFCFDEIDGSGASGKGFAGNEVVPLKGLVKDHLLAGDGIADPSGLAAHSGDEPRDLVDLKKISGPDDEAITGVFFAPEQIADDFVLGLDELIAQEILDLETVLASFCFPS